MPKLRSDQPPRNLDAINSAILGAAAEHYVMCQLLRRGKIAALAPAGVPDADIIVSDRLGSTLAAVQVKARRDIGNDGGWHMSLKHEDMRRDLLFYCFVDFGRSIDDTPKCWVIPSAVVANTLKATHQAWLETPGRNGRVHVDNKMRRLLPHYSVMNGASEYSTGWLDPYRDAWNSIATATMA
jgi:hypothetical protein